MCFLIRGCPADTIVFAFSSFCLKGSPQAPGIYSATFTLTEENRDQHLPIWSGSRQSPAHGVFIFATCHKRSSSAAGCCLHFEGQRRKWHIWGMPNPREAFPRENTSVIAASLNTDVASILRNHLTSMCVSETLG